MSRIAAVSIAILAALMLAGSAIAKSGFEARLDAPIPTELSAGSTVRVGWTLVDPRSDGVLEMVSTFLRVHPLGGAAFEVAGREGPAGHYTATFRAPPGGIVLVDIGMLGESCELGRCTRSDVLFPVVEPAPVEAASSPVSAAAPDGRAPGTAGIGVAPATGDKLRPTPNESTLAASALIVLVGLLVVGCAIAIRQVGRRA